MPENQLTTDEKRAQLLEFVPEDTAVAPMQFIGLVAEQILGRDKQGNFRPASDLKLFLYQCKRTGLDPLARQIYAVYRTSKVGDQWVDKMTIQSSIDGLRLIAERTGKFAGQDVVKYEYDKNNILISATATVYKITSLAGQPFPTSASADWDEYKQVNREGQPMGLWGKMPKAMLGKVAEALALRKAFPQEMSGLYTGEEMAQAHIVTPEYVAGPTTGDTNDGVIKEPVKPSRGAQRLAQAVTAVTPPESENSLQDLQFTAQKVLEKKTKNDKPFKSVLTELGWMTAWSEVMDDIEEGGTYFATVEKDGAFLTIIKVIDSKDMLGSVDPEAEINIDDIHIN